MKVDKNNRVLASIIVITYNSAKFVLEALESAKAQTYQNLELIISDDCSSDDTVQICKKWIEKNKGRFVRTELITVEKNTGTSANFNRGLKAAKGEWIKSVAGDDALMSDCIDINLKYIKTDQNIKIVQSECKIYQDNFEEKCSIGRTNCNNICFFKEGITSEEQYQLLLKKNRVIGPAVFIKKSVLEEVGGYDEDFKLIDDFPMWIILTKNKNKIHFLDEITVKYRKSSNSVINNGRMFISEKYAREMLILFKKYLRNDITTYRYLRYNIYLYLTIVMNKLGCNRKNLFSRFLHKIIFILSPGFSK